MKRARVTPIRWAWAVLLLAAGCGRSPLARDGGHDLRPPDRGPPGEGVRPCAPTCAEICSLRKSCALLPSGGYDVCVDACESAPAQPVNLCLGQIACREGATSCKEVQACVVSPTLPDLALQKLAASSPGQGKLALSVQVCNQGSAPALPSALHFYFNRSKAPLVKEPGDRVLKLAGLAAGACVEQASVESVAGGSYASFAQIDAENGVLESNEANNVAGPAFTLVGGKSLPDLTVTSLVGSASGGSASYAARVCNIGSAPSGATTLDLYVNRPSAPPPTLPGEATLEVVPLAAGSCLQLTATAVPVGAGVQSSWAQVDRSNLVGEHSESNNVLGPVAVQGGELPDLVVNTLIAADAGGNTASFSATICNHGKLASGPVDLAFYPHRTSAPDASSLPTASKTVPALAAGVCTPLSWYHGYVSPGVYSAWVWVDRLDVVQESDEKNIYGPVKVVVGGGPPDLSLALSAAVGSGGAVTYTALVCNKGIGTSPSASLDLYYHSPSKPQAFQSGDQSTAVPPIQPGDCTPVKLVASLSTGTYLSRAWIDRSDLVQESVETNNLTDPLTVSVNAGNGPDLVVTSFSTFVNASNVYYYATVCNAGTGYSSVSTLELYYDRATAPTPASPGDQQKSVISLGAGGCMSFTFATTLPSGSYQAWAYIDRADATKESNETNNVKGPVQVTVSGGAGVDLVVSALTFDYAAAAYKVTVCNKGGGSSWAATVDLYYNRATAPKANDWGNASLPLASLAGGACTTLSHAAKLTPGTYSSWAYVDRFGQVPESDETNNVYGPLLVTLGPTGADLVVSGFNAAVGAGGAVSYAIQVCNKGTAPSSACYLSVYYHATTPPTAATKADGSIFLGPLLAGGCSPFSWNGKLTPGTTNLSWAWIDSTSMVPELDEANNLAGPLSVKVGGGDPCQTICDALVSPCALLPPAQHADCMLSCKGRSQTKLDCALQAVAQGKCLEIVSCLFS